VEQEPATATLLNLQEGIEDEKGTTHNILKSIGRWSERQNKHQEEALGFRETHDLLTEDETYGRGG